MTKAITQVDLKLLEELIADPANAMGTVAELCGCSVEHIYSHKNSDNGFNRAYQRGQLRREAANIGHNGSSCDDIVLRAIGLGFGTRKELKEALGFGYDVIEKCLERQSGELRYDTNSVIEHFTLTTPLNRDGEIVPAEKQTSNSFQSERRMISQQDKTCGCGNPITHSGRCWFRRGDPKPLDMGRRSRAKELPVDWNLSEKIREAIDPEKEFATSDIFAKLNNEYPEQMASYNHLALRGNITTVLSKMVSSKKLLLVAKANGTTQLCNVYKNAGDIVDDTTKEQFIDALKKVSKPHSKQSSRTTGLAIVSQPIQGELIQLEDKDIKDTEIQTLEATVGILKAECAELENLILLLEKRILLRYGEP